MTYTSETITFVMAQATQVWQLIGKTVRYNDISAGATEQSANTAW